MVIHKGGVGIALLMNGVVAVLRSNLLAENSSKTDSKAEMIADASEVTMSLSYHRHPL